MRIQKSDDFDPIKPQRYYNPHIHTHKRETIERTPG